MDTVLYVLGIGILVGSIFFLITGEIKKGDGLPDEEFL